MIGWESNSWLHFRRIFTTCHPRPRDMCQHVKRSSVTCYKYSITCQDDLLTVANAQSHVTAFPPISEAARSWSDDNVWCVPTASDDRYLSGVAKTRWLMTERVRFNDTSFLVLKNFTHTHTHSFTFRLSGDTRPKTGPNSFKLYVATWREMFEHAHVLTLTLTLTPLTLC